MLKISKNTNEVSMLKEMGINNITSILIEGNLENILFAHNFARDIKAELTFLQKCNINGNRDFFEELFEPNLSITASPRVFIIDKLDDFSTDVDIIVSNLLKNKNLKKVWVFISVNKQKRRELSSILIDNLQFVA